ncbi:MAG: Smr/MutS family protein [Bacilli bacterium]|nr:Smr/MutS family protein [Bacilli bacterium]
MNKLNDIVFANIYNKIDLHGQSREMARVSINDFIDDNVKMKNEIIVIVHGIGKGILREETQRTLKYNKNVLYYKQDNYNEGQTLVQLRSDIMNKNGFTLTEILAVVVILGLLMLIIAPNLLNSVKNREEQITNTQKQMIEEAAELYLDSSDQTTGCVTIATLRDSGFLNHDISDITSKNDNFDNAGVKFDKTKTPNEFIYTASCN